MPAPPGNTYAAGNKGGGATPLYKPEYAAMAEKIALLGATDADLAGVFDVCEATINVWKKEHQEFSRALSRGKLEADAEVASSFYHRARGYSHSAVKIFMPAGAKEPVYAPYTEHYPPDTQAASLWLRNRQPKLWRDRTEAPGESGGITIVGGLPED